MTDQPTIDQIISIISEYEERIIADQLAFDTLDKTLQKIGDITSKAIHQGEPAYKKALKDIMAICKSIN